MIVNESADYLAAAAQFVCGVWHVSTRWLTGSYAPCLCAGVLRGHRYRLPLFSSSSRSKLYKPCKEGRIHKAALSMWVVCFSALPPPAVPLRTWWVPLKEGCLINLNLKSSLHKHRSEAQLVFPACPHSAWPSSHWSLVLFWWEVLLLSFCVSVVCSTSQQKVSICAAAGNCYE